MQLAYALDNALTCEELKLYQCWQLDVGLQRLIGLQMLCTFLLL